MDSADVSDRRVRLFIVLNAVLAVACGLWVLLFAVIFLSAVVFSGDPADELLVGAVGCAVLAAPGTLGVGLYTAAAVGLSRRRSWGYACHILGVALAALSCVGLPYFVFASVYMALPAFAEDCVRPDPGSDWADE